MIIQDNNLADIKVGDSASFSRLVTANDLIKFAELSGDYNPLHLDNHYASQTEFGGLIVHGFFLGALVSRLIGMQLPGKKSLILKESLEFKQPARIGDELLVTGEVVHKSEATRLIEVSIVISCQQKILTSGQIYVRLL